MLKACELKKAIDGHKARSKWVEGVKVYAYELIEEWAENNGGDDAEFYGSPADKKALLNGADSWDEYSWGGCSLIYDGDIAERLSTPSELKRNKHGENRPNSREEWLDTQARALNQAARLILRLAKN